MLPLAIEGLIAGYGGAPVLDGISFTLLPRERLGLFGPNGQGKTTLLRAISGLVRAREGSIELFGDEVAGLAPSRIVAMGLTHVPQSSELFPEMEVEETLRLAAWRPRAREDAEATLDFALTILPRLAERRRHKVKTLSGGERQMVAIAAGLMGAPRLLMLDEPTLGLSPKLKDELVTALGSVAATGLPMIIVEQDVEFLLELTNRLLMVDQGRIGAEIHASNGLDHSAIVDLYFGKGRAA